MSEDEMFRFLDFLGHQTACEILVDKEWKDIVKKDSSAIFVTDGIADEDGWRKAEVKVLYLLKEVNGADEEWDERDYLSYYNEKESYINTHSPTIDALIKWQFGITDCGKCSWSDVENELRDKEKQSTLLKQMCLVNIKKTAGGGIAWHLCQIKEWDYNKWQQTSRGIRYYKDENTTYIDFCHPHRNSIDFQGFFGALFWGGISCVVPLLYSMLR